MNVDYALLLVMKLAPGDNITVTELNAMTHIPDELIIARLDTLIKQGRVFRDAQVKAWYSISSLGLLVLKDQGMRGFEDYD